jgi:hypothetical protein
LAETKPPHHHSHRQSKGTAEAVRDAEAMAPSKATSSHLSLLADTTLTSLYERERLIRLGAHPSASDDAEIRHSLDTLKLGLGQLEKELEDLERDGASSQDLKQREDVVIKLQSQVPSFLVLC